jgi:hypothetical protein
VQRELALTKDQVADVKAITNRFNAAWIAVGGGVRIRNVSKKPNGLVSSFQEAAMPPFAYRGGIKGDKKDERVESLKTMIDLWNATTSKSQAELPATLAPDQYKRLQQISWQAMGALAFFDPEVVDKLQITEAQQTAILSTTDDYWLLRRESAKNGGSNEQIREKIAEATQARESKVYEALSKEQLEIFAKMKGEEFDLNLLIDPAR